MCSEIGETFAALREIGRRKRAANNESSTAILADRGIEFEAKNNGIHLIVRTKAHAVDFWPSTGKWIARNKQQTQGRGVFNLLNHISKTDEATK